MVKHVDDLQKLGKDNVETALKSLGAASKGWQAIAVEMTEYTKKSFEDGTAAMEKLLGAKSMDKAFEVQSEYLRAAYEGFVAEAGKLGELYVDLANQTFKPYEGAFAKASAT